MEKSSNIKKYINAILSILALVAFDQYTKYLAILKLKNQDSFVIWDGVFELHYLENRGAAFGMLQNQRIYFIIITVLIMIGVIYIYCKTPATKKYLPMRVCIIFLTSGALGNFIDRLFRGYVVDFFYFSLINFPIFNVADIYVTVVFFMLVLLLTVVYKDDDLSIYSWKKRED